MPALPSARGPLTQRLFTALRGRVQPLRPLPDPTSSEDLHLALHVLYGLSYQGFEGVDDRWEWDPSLIACRGELESRFEADLFRAVGRPVTIHPDDLGQSVQRLLSTTSDGPALSAWMEEHATLEHVREFAAHRSISQRKEADAHTFGLPRLHGAPKAAMVRIQFDEYGNGEPEAMHADLFARTLIALDLDPDHGAYLDHVPAATLASDNLMSMFGLHRRWRGALVGHLAAFELASVEPMGRHARTLERLGLDRDARRFFDVHVAADAVHAEVALEMVREFCATEPDLCSDVLFGVRALTWCEQRFTRHLIGSWTDGESSLRRPLAADGRERVAG